ncbi:MAG: 4Fe-4S binding protein [Rikenellaceae bacterium]
MNFITINNSLCTGCNQCLKNCPKNAIEVREGVYSIDYSLCVSCGKCFKTCAEDAIRLNIPVEQINEAFDKAKQYEESNSSVQQLSSESKFLREQIKILNSRFKTLVAKLNEAILVVDASGKIAFSNSHFIKMLDRKIQDELLHGGRIEGVDVKRHLSPSLYHQMLSVQNKGNDLMRIETIIGNTKVSASIHSVKRGDFTLIIFRNLGDPLVLHDQAVKQLETVIKQNMTMVQKIGFLLGEEISETSTILQQTINSLSVDDSK